MSVVNLVKNPDFQNLTGWSTNITSPNIVNYSIDPDKSYTEGVCLQITKSTAQEGGVFQTIDFNRDIEGEDFTVGSWVRIDTCDVGGAVNVLILWYTSSDTYISTSTIASLTAAQNYTLATGTATAPATATKMILYLKVTGGALNITTYIDTCYIYGEKSYGLLVNDLAGKSVFLMPDVSTVVATGTTSLSNSLNADSTYGTEINLPTLTDVDSNDIGVICQVRDFDWKAKVKTIGVDSNTHYWGNFYGDSGISYYDKDDDTGIMTPWTAGNLTDGDKSTWNPMFSAGLLSGWDKKTTETSKVRLFAAMYYQFLQSVVGAPTTGTLYARNASINVNYVNGTLMTTSVGASPYTYTTQTLDSFSILLFGPNTHFDVYVVHADGSTATLGTNVASYDNGQNWSTLESAAQTFSATWNCPATTLVPTDSLKIVMHVAGRWCNHQLSTYDWSYDITFTTGHLNWTALHASTWTFSRYIDYSRGPIGWYSVGQLRSCWGDASKEIKFSGLSYTPLAGSIKKVCSIGDNGVSEVDYMVYMKNYKGLSD